MSDSVIDGLQNHNAGYVAGSAGVPKIAAGATDESIENSSGNIWPKMVNAVAQNLKCKRGTAELLVIGAIGIVIYKWML